MYFIESSAKREGFCSYPEAGWQDALMLSMRSLNKCGWGQMTIIPHICQFWGTTTLFRSVKGAPKSAQICDKNSQKWQKPAKI